MIELFDKISHLCKDHTKKLTRHLNNDPHLAEYPSIKQQLINIASIGQLFADCFSDTRHQIKKELVAINSTPKCTFKKEMQQAHQQVDINNEKLAQCIKKQDKIQYDLNELNNQLNDTLLKTTKRHEVESKQETLKQRLREYEARVKSAQTECQNAKKEYEQEATRLFYRSQHREFQQLQKLNNYIRLYIKALQIPSCINQIKLIGNQLATEHDLKQDLQTWQRTSIGTSFSDKWITKFEQHHQAYLVEEPSSDDDDDDNDDDDYQDDTCTAVVIHKTNSRKR
jgi:hypothetical protein